MIKSMTGFGRGEQVNDDRKIVVEIKAVNHRFCDMNVKLPKKLNYFETDIRTCLKEYIQRGKVDVCITIIATGIEDNAATQPVMQNPAKPSAVKPTVAPVGKTPTYASQPITSVKPMGTATKPSFMSTPAAKPSVSADISSAAKPAPAKRETGNGGGIKIPDFLKRG